MCDSAQTGCSRFHMSKAKLVARGANRNLTGMFVTVIGKWEHSNERSGGTRT
jgi:hypothetical protein